MIGCRRGAERMLVNGRGGARPLCGGSRLLRRLRGRRHSLERERERGRERERERERNRLAKE